MNLETLIEKLNEFWKKKGCLIGQPIDLEVGAGTFHWLTFFKALGPEPWRAAYVQPTRRATDGRYADNPLRMQSYFQYQVILKPAPSDVKQIYLDSLKALGLNLLEYDLRFVEDDWESPTLGASGLGWEVWLDSLEATQFTYFQQIGGMELDMVSCELTYGLERIAMLLSDKKDVWQLNWNNKVSYGELFKEREEQFSVYNFGVPREIDRPGTKYSKALGEEIEVLFNIFRQYEKNAETLLNLKLLYPAYEYVLKASHIFNLLDARGAVSVAERPSLIGRIRNLAKGCAGLYLKKNE